MGEGRKGRKREVKKEERTYLRKNIERKRVIKEKQNERWTEGKNEGKNEERNGGRNEGMNEGRMKEGMKGGVKEGMREGRHLNMGSTWSASVAYLQKQGCPMMGMPASVEIFCSCWVKVL